MVIVYFRQQKEMRVIGRRQWMGGAALVLDGWSLSAARARAEGGFAGLSRAFARIEAVRGGRLGVAVLDTDSGRRAGFRQEERFPMCSTVKLLAVGAVLARVDTGQESLERRILFSKNDLVAYSPSTEKEVDGNGMTLASICDAAITLGDNTAGNLLLGTLGGPPGLTAYARSLGDAVTRLDRCETALNEGRPGDPRDTTSPASMLANPQALTLGPSLSASGKAQFLQWLRASELGKARLRARLPRDWRAAKKPVLQTRPATMSAALAAGCCRSGSGGRLPYRKRGQ